MSFIPEAHLVPLNKTDLDRKALGKKKKKKNKQNLKHQKLGHIFVEEQMFQLMQVT